MTALEMKATFLTLYDAATSLAAPGWENSEISDFLNAAQTELIKELNFGNKQNLLSAIITDTSAITSVTTPALVTDTLVKNSFTYDTTALTDFLYYISSQSKYTRTDPTAIADYIYNEEISFKQASQFVVTPFNKPYFRVPKVFLLNKKLRVISDYYTTITALVVTYIRKPLSISIDGTINCELNVALHQDVVQTAVNLAVESIKKAKISNQ
jgi:hypothetical protein